MDREAQPYIRSFVELSPGERAEATLAAAKQVAVMIRGGIQNAEGTLEVELPSGEIAEAPFSFVIGLAEEIVRTPE